MAYMVYEFRGNEKISDIASQFNTTIEEIMKINNVSPPYPQYAKDLPDYVLKGENKNQLEVPFVTNGKQSFESYNNNAYNNLGVNYRTAENLKAHMYGNLDERQSVEKSFRNLRPGRNPIDCYISAFTDMGSIGTNNINNSKYGYTSWQFPCYPESISDSNSANYNPVNILGRSEPFQYYQHSGPRSVNVSFTMHSDCVPQNLDYIYKLVAFIEACCYPRYDTNIAATKVIFHCAKNIHITGIIKSVSTKYSGPILDMNPGASGNYVGNTDNNAVIYDSAKKYAVVDVDFTIEEVTGNPPSFYDIVNVGGYRNATIL